MHGPTHGNLGLLAHGCWNCGFGSGGQSGPDVERCAAPDGQDGETGGKT